jgi:hypothetical protein
MIDLPPQPPFQVSAAITEPSAFGVACLSGGGGAGVLETLPTDGTREIKFTRLLFSGPESWISISTNLNPSQPTAFVSIADAESSPTWAQSVSSRTFVTRRAGPIFLVVRTSGPATRIDYCLHVRPVF